MTGKLKRARVIRSVGDYHTVMLPSGKQLICRTRGRVRRDLKILPGDVVQILIESDEGIIHNVEKRRSELLRPPIANVDQAMIVIAMSRPKPALQLLDKMLIMAEREKLDVAIVFNKIDLATAETLDELENSLKSTGYPIFKTSVKTGEGIQEVKNKLRGRISVLAGSSGVGKSSILNMVLPGANIETGDVSERIERGRHTTRHVSLLSLDGGGWVADSPGFASLALTNMDPRELPFYYRDYVRFSDECRFSGCLHSEEPGCRIKKMVAEGILDSHRYDRYMSILAEVGDAFERRY